MGVLNKEKLGLNKSNNDLNNLKTGYKIMIVDEISVLIVLKDSKFSAGHNRQS